TSGELQKDSSQWLVLRDLLDRSRLILQQQSKRPKSWMQPLNDYPELLRTQPTKRLAVDFVHDPDDQKTIQLAEALHISEASWFWEALVQQAVKSICELNDAVFLSKIDRLIHLMTKRPTYTQLILSSTLDHYAQSTQRDLVHEQLKNIALKQWGNPQYESSAGWLNVKPNTKQMVIRWFVQADLEAFFRLFSQTADERRFQYWMRFIKQISYSQIFLGRNALYSRQTDQQKFISSNKGRLFELIGGASSNNSFMLKIGNIYIVEFSETGNACYLYNRMPFEHSSRTTFSLTDDLKNKSKPPFICTLKHTHFWEERFDEKLAQLGIFPDGNAKKNSTSATGYRRM
ncbi:MAG: EH signature domain-containing protein, partial [Moraxellaceae bacterium]